MAASQEAQAEATSDEEKMTPKFLGSQPDGTNEYCCELCLRFFELRQTDENGEPLFEDEPLRCPYCPIGLTTVSLASGIVL
jgi:hypothetical protein